MSGHMCVGFCEWDKFAAASYTSMHLITDHQMEYLSTLSLKKRQKEILKDEYRNGEWYASDIMGVDATSLPDANCWTFGAPCQDFSIAGKRAGLEGDRSSLVREVFRLLEEMQEKDRPEWLIYENVKGMLSSNRGIDFLSILSEMDRLGYDIQWQNMHTEWYLPHHRERIYTVGHLRGQGRAEIFPITGTDGENNVLQIGMMKSKRENPNAYRCYSDNGISPTLGTMQGGGIEPNVAIPVIMPDRENKRQNGRRFKENGEPMFTLTAQDRHGVGIAPIGIIGGLQEHQTIREDGLSPALTSAMGMGGGQTPCVFLRQKEKPKQGDGIYVEMPGGFLAYCVWYEKCQCYIAIRKLTPKECFRLQGWSDEYFERAALVNSDSQLYKQAGNGVSVPVVKVIGDKIAEFERKRFEQCMNKPERTDVR